jgi:hypothetical protein
MVYVLHTRQERNPKNRRKKKIACRGVCFTYKSGIQKTDEKRKLPAVVYTFYIQERNPEN